MIFIAWLLIFSVLLLMVFPRFFAWVTIAWVSMIAACLVVFAIHKITKARHSKVIDA